MKQRLIDIRKEYNKHFDRYMKGNISKEEWLRLEKKLTHEGTALRREYGDE